MPEAPRLAINHFGKWPLEDALRSLARHGYQAVDYSAAAGRLAADHDALTSIKRLAGTLGLAAAGTHFRSFGFGFLLPDRKETFASESVADVRAAAFLGAPAIAFHLANALSSGPVAPDADLEAANAEALRPAVHVAEQEGVVVALENHCHGFGERWVHLEAVAAALNSPAVGFTLDSGHAAVAGQAPDRLARQMGARLALTHLHDNDGSADQHRPAGRSGPNGATAGGGVIDWPALLQALQDAGYPTRNAWVLEGGTQLPGDDPDTLVAAHRQAFLHQLWQNQGE